MISTACTEGAHESCSGRIPMHTRSDTVWLCDCSCHPGQKDD